MFQDQASEGVVSDSMYNEVVLWCVSGPGVCEGGGHQVRGRLPHPVLPEASLPGPPLRQDDGRLLLPQVSPEPALHGA